MAHDAPEHLKDFFHFSVFCFISLHHQQRRDVLGARSRVPSPVLHARLLYGALRPTGTRAPLSRQLNRRIESPYKLQYNLHTAVQPAGEPPVLGQYCNFRL
jgi:hypothetical protein